MMQYLGVLEVCISILYFNFCRIVYKAFQCASRDGALRMEPRANFRAQVAILQTGSSTMSVMKIMSRRFRQQSTTSASRHRLRQHPPADSHQPPHPVNSKRKVSTRASGLHFASQSVLATFNILIVAGPPACSHPGPI